MDEFIMLISNMGFPIACAVGMGLYFMNQSKYEREENSKREERLFGMIEANVKVINENTTAIKNLQVAIERGKKNGAISYTTD